MKKLFAPCEIAVIAEEKGFDEECLGVWDTKNNFLEIPYSGDSGYYVGAPLYQQLIDWFREKHKM